jgi:hypothetical protein
MPSSFNHTTDPLKVYGGEMVKLLGSFGPNGSSGIAQVQGNGGLNGTIPFKVARTSAGLYKITLDHGWPELITAVGSAQVNSEVDQTIVTFGQYSAATASAPATMDLLVSQKEQGFIPLELVNARELVTNQFDTVASSGFHVGGLLGNGTTPSAIVTNPGTDGSAYLSWVASNSAKISWPGIPVPPDVNAAGIITVNLLACMSGSTDTPAITVDAWNGVGGTTLGGATPALAPATSSQPNLVQLALSAAVAYPSPLTIGLTPGAHTTNAVNLYAAWLTYVKASNLVDLAANANNSVSFELTFRGTSSKPY